jgi:hypothetical protein
LRESEADQKDLSVKKEIVLNVLKIKLKVLFKFILRDINK